MKYQPSTVDEAVDYLLAVLSDEVKQTIRAMPEHEVGANLHFGLGMGIRNSLGLWHGNHELLVACGSFHPDDASGVIVDALWRRLQDA